MRRESGREQDRGQERWRGKQSGWEKGDKEDRKKRKCNGRKKCTHCHNAEHCFLEVNLLIDWGRRKIPRARGKNGFNLDWFAFLLFVLGFFCSLRCYPLPLMFGPEFFSLRKRLALLFRSFTHVLSQPNAAQKWAVVIPTSSVMVGGPPTE